MTTEPRVRLDFQVLVYPEDGLWIAHCLETDLAAEGSNPKSAFSSLIDITNVLVENAIDEGDIPSIFSPAPPELWHMYSIASEPKSPSRRPRRLNSFVQRVSRRQLVLN